MARKPFVKKQAKDWYKENPFYIVYLLRELTSIPVALAALNLFWGLATLAGSPEAWMSWCAFQRNPIILLLNLVAIVAATYNSLEWFKAMPKAFRIQRGTQFIPDKFLILGSWGAFAGIFLILLIICIALA